MRASQSRTLSCPSVLRAAGHGDRPRGPSPGLCSCLPERCPMEVRSREARSQRRAPTLLPCTLPSQRSPRLAPHHALRPQTRRARTDLAAPAAASDSEAPPVREGDGARRTCHAGDSDDGSPPRAPQPTPRPAAHRPFRPDRHRSRLGAGSLACRWRLARPAEAPRRRHKTTSRPPRAARRRMSTGRGGRSDAVLGDTNPLRAIKTNHTQIPPIFVCYSPKLIHSPTATNGAKKNWKPFFLQPLVGTCPPPQKPHI